MIARRTKTCTALFMAVMSAALLSAAPAAHAQDAKAKQKEAAVKAAYLFNFIKLSRWPKKSFAKPEDPIVVGLVGAGPVADIFAKAAEERKVQNRPLRALRLRCPDLEDFEDPKAHAAAMGVFRETLRGCHVVYFTQAHAAHTPELIKALGGSDTLTVGDIPRFAHDGGMIGLALNRQNKRLEFTVNMATVKKTGIKISSQLLRLANVIETANGVAQPFSARRAGGR